MLSISPAALNRHSFASVATMSSGACMAGGGYVLNDGVWWVSGLLMIAGGSLIALAFTLTLRKRHRAPRAVPDAGSVSNGRDQAGIVRVPWQQGAIVIALTVASGAVMVVAGYAAAAWMSMLLVPLVLVGGLSIVAAFVVLVSKTDR